jgi:hypothetical protein
MAGRHSKRGARARIPEQQKPYRPSIELVDARTKQAHLLTLTAYEAGFDPHAAYVALCGAEVLPACLAEPGRGYCGPCRSRINPAGSRITTPKRSMRWWSR